jgi:hypothetical protein
MYAALNAVMANQLDTSITNSTFQQAINGPNAKINGGKL